MMPERYLFEYAVIRVVPRVEREEFINVGVIVFCPGKKYLKFVYDLDDTRLLALWREADCAEMRSYLHALEKISEGGRQGGFIGSLPQASRFRWLSATRSSVVEASKVHPGLCEDPERELQKLFRQLVL